MAIVAHIVGPELHVGPPDELAGLLDELCAMGRRDATRDLAALKLAELVTRDNHGRTLLLLLSAELAGIRAQLHRGTPDRAPAPALDVARHVLPDRAPPARRAVI